MRPPLIAPRWSQLRRPVTPSTILSHRIRSFHATRPAAFVPELISAATGLLHNVHEVSGLPWVATIPIVAVGVRTFVAVPIMIWSRIISRRNSDIQPIIHCCRKHYEDAIRAKGVEEFLSRTPHEASKELHKQLKKKTSALQKEWNISNWAFFIPALQLPIWLVLMEGMRNICGVNAGILGLLRYLNPLSDKNDSLSLDLPGAEPSLATEGALWFPDLLAGDPTGILPAVLGLTIMANVRKAFGTQSAAEISDQDAGRLFANTALWTVKQFLTFMGAYIAFSAWMTGMPAGMMLYWIVSTNTAVLQHKFLDKYMFLSVPMMPAPKRQIRILKPGETPPPTMRLFK